MGFLVTTLIFIVIGIIASLCTRICCNRGPSANLNFIPPGIIFRVKPLTCGPSRPLAQIVPSNIGYYSNDVLLDDVGNCISCTNETTHSPYSK